MGTTLTGTTPATTYDSLIKVTDNGPLSATAKYLSDGLGNDSSLALSTGFVGIGNIPSNAYDGYKLQVGSIADSQTFISIGNSSSGLGPLNGLVIGCDSTGADIYQRENQPLRLHTNGSERMRIDSAGNVGIGTSSPSGKLHVAGGDIFLGASYALKYNSTSYITPENNVSGAEVSTGGVFVVKTGVSPAERLRVDASGNVGIGTSSPKNVLDLGAASLGRGLTFDNFSNIFSSYSAGDLVLSSNFYGSTASDSYLTSTTATFGAAGIRISGTQGGATSGQIQFFANAAAAKTAGTAFTPTEICRVTTSGLTFNGDTAAANALDDYEEGTFTPTTAGDATGAFSGVLGEYTKIGNVVHFRIAATISTNFTSSDIGGLPFTIGGGGSPSGIVGLFSVANSSSGTLVARLDAATTTIKTYSDNNVNNPIAPSTAMLTLRVFGTYRV